MDDLGYLFPGGKYNFLISNTFVCFHQQPFSTNYALFCLQSDIFSKQRKIGRGRPLRKPLVVQVSADGRKNQLEVGLGAVLQLFLLLTNNNSLYIYFFHSEHCCHEPPETLRLMCAPSPFSPIHLLQVINPHKCVTLVLTFKCTFIRTWSIWTLMPRVNVITTKYHTKWHFIKKKTLSSKNFIKNKFVRFKW